MEVQPPQYAAHSQAGREGVSAQTRESMRDEERRARTPEGQREAQLRSEIAKLEARLQRVEKGDNLTPGNGISINGTNIALSDPTGNTTRASTEVIEDVIMVFNGTAYYVDLNGEIKEAVVV